MESYREKFKGDSNAIRASYPKEWQVAKICDARFKHIAPSNVYSQFGEDGLLRGVFDVIGVKHMRCFEVGASDGEFFSNTKALRDNDWSAILAESDSKDSDNLSRNCRSEKVTCLWCEVCKERGIDCWFSDYETDYDLGVIDIDGGDAEAWQRMDLIRPRVMVVECAENWGMNENTDQAHISKLNALACYKGYTCVALTYCNAIFVANEELPSMPVKQKARKILAIVSEPRIIFSGTTSCAERAFFAFDIQSHRFGGAYWEQGIQAGIEFAIEQGFDDVVTLDYDSIFTVDQFGHMLRVWRDNPQIDAMSCLQPQRGTGATMLSASGPEGPMEIKHTDTPSFQADTAHFGLTFIRLGSLKKVAKPWFWSQPSPIELPEEIAKIWPNGLSALLKEKLCVQFLNPGEKSPDSGRWRCNTNTDADIYFWRKWKSAGNNLFILPEILLGHLEEVVSQHNPKTGKADYRFASNAHEEPFSGKVVG